MITGTGQAYVPGGGHRTGPPGKHVIGGKAKFRIQDEKVRYYVGPGLQVMENTEVSILLRGHHILGIILNIFELHLHYCSSYITFRPLPP